VNDKVGMGVGYCAEHIEEKSDACIHAQSVLVAELVNVFSFHVLQNEIRFSVPSHSSVNQLGDVRMPQLAQNSAFAFEPFNHRWGSDRKVHELDRHLALEAAIGTLGEPDVPHATFTYSGDELVGPMVSLMEATSVGGCGGWTSKKFS